jgi:hypothetical protein
MFRFQYFFLAAVLLSACSNANRTYHDSREFFGVAIKLTFYDVDKATAAQAFNAVGRFRVHAYHVASVAFWLTGAYQSIAGNAA